MENYIVRIKTYIAGEVFEYGTGVVVSENKVITAQHVVCGDEQEVICDDKEYRAEIEHECGEIVVLKTEESMPVCVFPEFTMDEVLDNAMNWCSEGYISSAQNMHYIHGKSIHSVTREVYLLTEIDAGSAMNYQGMSGAPVFVEKRIVGILQEQVTTANNGLDLKMSSVSNFVELIPVELMRTSLYLEKLKEKCLETTREKLDINIRSQKYIPEIFVEEDRYKECFRYFSDPVLFLKKSIQEISRLDFGEINKFIVDFEEEPIEFLKQDYFVTSGKVIDIAEKLILWIKETTEKIRRLDSSNMHEKMSIEKRHELWATMNRSIVFYLQGFEIYLSYIKYSYILLTREAGQGKTNLLCDFAENVLIKKGYCVLYYNAAEFVGDPWNYLMRNLTLEESYTKEYIFKALEQNYNKQQKPIMVLIDGLNENGSENFGTLMRDFLQKCEFVPKLKVMMTTREELFEERFSMIQQGEYTGKIKIIHMDRPGKNELFADRIFDGYMKHFHITISRRTERAYKTLTQDTLLLRFFAEVYEGRKSVDLYDIYKYPLFTKYIEKKSEEYQKINQLNPKDEVKALLDKMAEYMLDHKKFDVIPISEFDHNQKKILEWMLENSVAFKSNESVQEGFLVETHSTVGFTFDEFRDYVITNYVLAKKGTEKLFLEFWNQMVSEDYIIREGVQKFAFLFSKSVPSIGLLPIIQKTEEYEKLYWKNIWSVEDQYITDEDIQLWREHVLKHGTSSMRVVSYLIWRYDCDYFTKVNIRYLMGILDELSNDFTFYESFLEKCFGCVKYDKYGSVIDYGKVFPVDDMKEFICEKLNNGKAKELKELLKFASYLIDIGTHEVRDIYKTLYNKHPKVTIEILWELNSSSCKTVLANTKEILSILQFMDQDECWKVEIKELYEANPFGDIVSYDWHNLLISIFGDTL